MRRRGTVRKQQLGATGLRPGEGEQGTTLSALPERTPGPTRDGGTERGRQRRPNAASMGHEEQVCGAEDRTLPRPPRRASGTAGSCGDLASGDLKVAGPGAAHSLSLEARSRKGTKIDGLCGSQRAEFIEN